MGGARDGILINADRRGKHAANKIIGAEIA